MDETRSDEELLSTLHAAADESALKIAPLFRGNFSVDHKDGKGIFDPVTIADRAGEQVIREVILSRYAEDAVIGEEMQDVTGNSGYCWVIDPIDGTRAFIIGSPLWGTLIGVNKDGRPYMGMMNQPFTGERFWAGPSGSYLSYKGEVIPLQTRKCEALADAVITTTCPDLFREASDLQRFNKLKAACMMSRYGGDCYNYCLLAMGHVDLVVESGLQAFDIAPLVPIVERAGGMLTSWDGGPAGDGGRIIAAGSKAIHEAALEILAG